MYLDLDQTNKTNEKVDLLVDYFTVANDTDKLWALALLSSRRPKRAVNTTKLRYWACEYAGVEQWLFDESYQVVGDLAETITLILPHSNNQTHQSLSYWVNYIMALTGVEDDDCKQALFDAWQQMTQPEIFAFNKLLTGGFRIGISATLVSRAVAKATGQNQNTITHRLMGKWSPLNTTYQSLILSTTEDDDISKPYPFCLAYPIEGEPDSLGDPTQWQAEWKWDGIRGQIIKRNNELFIWSRGEELVTDKFPELGYLKDVFPNGTVLDGELLPYKDGNVLGFNVMQTRIGRKNISKKTLTDAPIAFFAYDCMEYQGNDLRQIPLVERRKILAEVIIQLGEGNVIVPQEVMFSSWDELKTIRSQACSVNSEGLMLKAKNSPYDVGRKKGNWWKWKLDPYSIDAVLIYAQKGHGRRANYYTDYTFALWDKGTLVPFAKAYSGLTDKEIKDVDAIVRQTTREKFGPVRSVDATMVFELGFEAINLSTRHKSGVAVRFPRILRWRTDKKIEEANTLDDLKALLGTQS